MLKSSSTVQTKTTLSRELSFAAPNLPLTYLEMMRASCRYRNPRMTRNGRSGTGRGMCWRIRFPLRHRRCQEPQEKLLRHPPWRRRLHMGSVYSPRSSVRTSLPCWLDALQIRISVEAFIGKAHGSGLLGFDSQITTSRASKFAGSHKYRSSLLIYP